MLFMRHARIQPKYWIIIRRCIVKDFFKTCYAYNLVFCDAVLFLLVLFFLRGHNTQYMQAIIYVGTV